jgi:hypothetical protein
VKLIWFSKKLPAVNPTTLIPKMNTIASVVLTDPITDIKVGTTNNGDHG